MYKSVIRALVSLSFLIYLVNCHGRLLKPTSRSEWCNSGDSRNITQLCNDRDWQYCEFVSHQYYYRGILILVLIDSLQFTKQLINTL